MGALDELFADVPDESKADEVKGEDLFASVGNEPARSPERGVLARATEGFKGNYHPVLEGALEQLVPNYGEFKRAHPTVLAGMQAAFDANPLAWLDKAFAAVPGAVVGGIPGAIAGLYEKVAGPTEADRLQVDLGVLGQALLLEPGMGGASAMSAYKHSLAARRARPAEAPLPEAPPAEAAPAEAAPRPAEVVPKYSREQLETLIRMAENQAPTFELNAADPRFPDETRAQYAMQAKGLRDAIPRYRQELDALGPAEKPGTSVTERPPSPMEDLFADVPDDRPAVAEPVREVAREEPVREQAPPAEPDAFADMLRGDEVPPDAYLPDDTPLGAPPAWVTERIPEEAAVRTEVSPDVSQRTFREEPPVAAAPPPVEATPKPKGKQPTPLTLTQFIAQNGGLELTPDAKAAGFNKIGSATQRLARKGGKSLDGFWRERLMEEGYLEPDADGYFSRDVRSEVYDMLQREAQGEKFYSVQDRGFLPERKPGEQELGVEQAAQTIVEAAKQIGLSRADIDTKVLYDAAQRLARGEAEAREPLNAYFAAIDDAARAPEATVRGVGPRVREIGEPGAKPGTESPLIGEGTDVSGSRAPRPTRPRPLVRVSPDALEHLQADFIETTGRPIMPVASVPMREALASMETGHLKGMPRAVAETVRKRLADVVGDTPVHFIAERDMAARYPHVVASDGSAPVGMWVTEHGKGGRSYILLNADYVADARAGAHTLLHEGTHAAAYGRIEKDPALKKSLRLLLDEADKHVTTESGRKYYGLTNEHEFLSEASGNGPFQEILAGAPASPMLVARLGGKGKIRTLWDAFVETIRRTLGYPPNARNLLEATLKVGERATREPVPVEPRVEARMERPKDEPGADNRPQLVIPGAERIGQGELVQRRADAPLKPKVAQKPMDKGLFSDQAAQTDMFDRPAKKAEPARLSEYEQAREAHNQAQREYAPAVERYRAREIGDDEFLAARKKYDQATAEFDKAYQKAQNAPERDLLGETPPKKGQTEMFMLRDAANEILTDRLTQRNMTRLARISDKLGGNKVNTVEFRAKAQDKIVRLKRLLDQWRKDNPGRALPEDWDAYTSESNSYGKKGAEMRRNEKEYFDPLVDAIAQQGLTRKETSDYIKAKHVPERNRELRKINPNIPDPAGMSDTRAGQILQAARPRQAAFDAAYQRFRALVDETLNLEVLYGLIKPETAREWRARWPDYAPLKHSEVGDRAGIGKGLEVRGKEHRQALGRETESDDPISHAMQQMQRVIIRGENNAVGRVLGDFAAANPEPAFWAYDAGPKIRYLDKTAGIVREMTDPRWKERDDVFTYKENGVEHSVWFKDPVHGPKVVRGLKNMGDAQMHRALRLWGNATRTLAKLSTSWSPEFPFINLFRDAPEALLNLSAEQKRGMGKSFVKHMWRGAFEGAFNGLMDRPGRGGAQAYTQAWREFETNGGRIDFFGMKSPEEFQSGIDRKLARLQGGKLNTMREIGERVLDAIDIVNGTLENGTRLAIYMAARDHGYTPKGAASLAREGTVNFNRKGEWGNVLTAGYMFANAGIQGPVRVSQSLAKSKATRKAAGGIAALGFALGVWNVLVGGRDEDGRSRYSKQATWDREGSFMMAVPYTEGKFFPVLPMPWGFGPFKIAGDHAATWMMDQIHGLPASAGGETAGNVAWKTFASLFEMFDPLGRDQNWYAHFLPTLLKPLAHIGFNENQFGLPVNPTKGYWNKGKPDSGSYYANASEQAKWLAQKMNAATGGSELKPGAVDVGPGTIDYLMQFVGGGLGRFVANSVHTGTRMYNGQEWQPERTPFVRRFYKAPSDQADRQIYFNERDKVQASHNQKEEGGIDQDSFKVFQNTDEKRKTFRSQVDALKRDQALRPADIERLVKDLREKEATLMFEARRHLEGARAGEEKRPPQFAAGGAVRLAGHNHTPSLAQKEAGNYAKGSAKFHGLDISIENAKGRKRTGVGKDGKPWSVVMPAHYGYIKGTVGSDKDHVDCYLGQFLKSPKVFVVNQKNPDTGKFDEHKCMLGFASEKHALNTYRKGFSDGRGAARIGSVWSPTLDEFKDWLANGDTTRAIAA